MLRIAEIITDNYLKIDPAPGSIFYAGDSQGRLALEWGFRGSASDVSPSQEPYIKPFFAFILACTWVGRPKRVMKPSAQVWS